MSYFPGFTNLLEMRDSGYLLSLIKRQLINDEWLDTILFFFRLEFKIKLVEKIYQNRDKIKYRGVDCKSRDDKLARCKFIEQKLSEACTQGSVLLIIGALHHIECASVSKKLASEKNRYSTGILLYNPKIFHLINDEISNNFYKSFEKHKGSNTTSEPKEEKDSNLTSQDDYDNFPIGVSQADGSFDINVPLCQLKELAADFHKKHLLQTRISQSQFFKLSRGRAPAAQELVSLSLPLMTVEKQQNTTEYNQKDISDLNTTISTLKPLHL